MMRMISGVLALLFLALPLHAEIAIREVTSPGGISAWLVEEPSIPFTALEIRFQGGASLDAPGKRGATNLMMALLEEGAGDLDAQGFAAAAETLAAGFGFGATDDAVSVSARFLSENRDEAVALLRAALHEPRFEETALERVRGQVLASIRADAKNPNALARQRFAGLAFGDHPYASSIEGTEESVAALTRADMIEAKDRVMARDRLFVAAVGDITEAELGALLDDLLGDLPATGAPLPARAEYALAGGVTTVPYETPQSVIVFAQPGLPRDDPDFFPAYVMLEALGGSRFSARLMHELREKRGLTYGISAHLVNLDHADYLSGGVSTANARVGETIAVIRDEWRKLAEDGLTLEELEEVKTYMTGAYPLRFDGNLPIARILVGMQMQGYDADYINRRNALIEAVTLEDVKRVAARLIQPEALHFIIAGQPEGLE